MTYDDFLDSFNKLNSSFKDLVIELINGLAKTKHNEIVSTYIFADIKAAMKKKHYSVMNIFNKAAKSNSPSAEYIDPEALKKCIQRKTVDSSQFPFLIETLGLSERWNEINENTALKAMLIGDLEWKYNHLDEAYQNLIYSITLRLLLIQEGISELDTSLI